MQIHELNPFIGEPGNSDYLALDNGVDTSKMSAAALIEPKLNRPIDNQNGYDDGVAGQLLRSKGDGSTEWSDVGNPTDAQTAQAVSDWLDNHPEATTTVADGSLTKAKFAPELQGLTYATDNGFNDTMLAAIATGSVSGTVTLSSDYKVYDFKGATVDTLVINCKGAIIKNFKTPNTVLVKTNSRNCYIENGRFESTSQSISFESDTWAFLFEKCTFIGGGSGICMNADTQTNDTLQMNNCYFYRFDKIINCQESLHINIVGGWCDDCNYIIYAYGNVNGATINILSFDAEQVTAVFKCAGYTYATFIFNGNIAYTSGCICDFASGAVDLLLGNTVSPLLKVFSSASPKVRYVNRKMDNEMDYPVRDVDTEQTVRLYIPPKTYVEPFGKLIHVFKADCSDTDIQFFINGGGYTKGTTWNGVVNFQVYNNSSSFKSADVVIKTKNIIMGA